jgi:hypothetical protein
MGETLAQARKTKMQASASPTVTNGANFCRLGHCVTIPLFTANQPSTRKR